MEYEYDSWNRIQKMTYPDREVVSYGYDKGGMLQWVTGEKNGAFHTYIDSISYNKFGLKELVLNSNGTESRYEYDVLLRLDSVTTYDGESNRHLLQVVKYSYDSVGNITSITNSAAMVNGIGGPYHVDYAYDSLYRITHAEGYHNTDETAYVVDMRYYANGRIQRKAVRQPDVFKNSVKWYSSQYSYPAQGNKLTGIFPSVSGGNLPTYLKLTEMHLQPHIPYTFTWENYNYSFQWDGAGNLIQQTNNVNNTVRQLSWDAENRLQGVKDNSYLSLYQYDANGERTYKLTGAGYIQNINGVPTRRYALVNATLYASPYLVATPKGYTKHYYAENERIASRIGGGGMFGIDTPIVNMDSVTDKQTANGAYMDEVIQEGLEVTYYTGDNLFDTFYYWKTVHSNFEPDCYWYHPDHLGSVSWVTDNNGEVVQYLYYLPWGEDYLNQRRNGYSGARHTFSAKEKDTETGYSYFGSRYYSSDLSIWLSVDPMSDKYPSLSPYTYCANNPIKLVDPNGEEIWIVGEDGNKYKYSKGELYTKEGELYKPESGSFLSDARNAIKALQSTKTGNGLISAFEGPNNKDVFIESSSNSTCDNLTTDVSGNFVSQTILWNSEGTQLETTAGLGKSSITDLGHEFSHVYDNAKNIKGLNDLYIGGGTRSEWRAVYKENLIRKELGLPCRSGYTFVNSNNNQYFVPMLNKKGEPYMPNSFKWIPFENCVKK